MPDKMQRCEVHDLWHASDGFCFPCEVLIYEGNNILANSSR